MRVGLPKRRWPSIHSAQDLYKDLSFSNPGLLTTRNTWIHEWRSLPWRATSLSAFRSVSQAGQRALVIPIGKLEIRSISLSSKSEGSRR
jgi:hypothetical protein